MFERAWIPVALLLAARAGEGPGVPPLEVHVVAHEAVGIADHRRWQGVCRVALRTGGGDAIVALELVDAEGRALELIAFGPGRADAAAGTVEIRGRADVRREGAYVAARAAAEVVFRPETGELWIRVPDRLADVALHFDDARLVALGAR